MEKQENGSKVEVRHKVDVAHRALLELFPSLEVDLVSCIAFVSLTFVQSSAPSRAVAEQLARELIQKQSSEIWASFWIPDKDTKMVSASCSTIFDLQAVANRRG